MRLRHIVAFFLLTTTAAWANLHLPKAKLVGETVDVRITNGSAEVTALFEFEDWMTSDAKVIYFPLFSFEKDDPVSVLARSRFDLVIRGNEAGPATPCSGPREVKAIPGGLRVFWFAVDLDRFDEDHELTTGGPLVIRVRYIQPLLNGRFYYMPIVAGHEARKEPTRNWNFQLFARSRDRIIRVVTPGAEWERLPDGLVAYLEDGELLGIE